ncbi:MAG: cytochrome c3 family protein [Planctomycetota bacterium]
MALLSRSASTRRTTRVVAALLVISVAGCAVVGALFSHSKPFAFSHKIHVVDQELDCEGCHLGATSSDDPGMPVIAQCKLCHEEIDSKKPPERRVDTLYKDGKFQAQHVNHAGGDVVFSHLKHTAKEIECAKCHVGIDNDERIVASSAIGMDDCRSCHAESKVASECATCHREIRTDHAPPSHAWAWSKKHGAIVRAKDEHTANQCSLCHQESSCVACHQETPPDNHNSYFRNRGHGAFARMDREGCASCHRSDSCDLCHSQAKPLNHTGQWGGTRSNHCVGCHFPLGKQECETCHHDTPSHLTAAPLPGNHAPGMNCRMCHGLTAPLPHVDKGDECGRCHR